MEDKDRAGIIEIFDNKSKIIGYIAVDAQISSDVICNMSELITKLTDGNITINLNTANLDDNKCLLLVVCLINVVVFIMI